MNALARSIAVTGIGAWTRGIPDWATLRGVLYGEGNPTDVAPATSSANLLPAAERRRAPDSVRLAVEVAAQACAMAHCDPSALPCVFATTHGEVAITDYVCATLADSPLELSPTKFHNSVLNAPAGYWTIATGCIAASSAVTACHRSFAAGLLEAAVFAWTEDVPVLFACCDVASTGPLAEMTRTSIPFGTALVLSPDAATGAHLRCSLREGDAGSLPPAGLALQDLAGDNPTNAQALAVLAALCGRQPTSLSLPLSPGLSLDMEITP